MSNTTKYRLKYTLTKAAQMILVLAVLSMAVFVIARLCPGDPLRSYYGDGVEHMSEVQREAAREKLGLNDSMLVQYERWVENLFDGDLGLSYKYKLPVTEVIGRSLGQYSDPGRRFLRADLRSSDSAGLLLRAAGGPAGGQSDLQNRRGIQLRTIFFSGPAADFDLRGGAGDTAGRRSLFLWKQPQRL